jgi:hypothetical protein
LNAVYAKPSNKSEEGQDSFIKNIMSLKCWFLDDLRAYIKQLRLETGLRIISKVFESSEKPSKVII